MDFLGIYKVVSEKTKLTGVKLFEGLLLGGEVVYETPKEKEEKERQDLQLEIPWYQVGSGTKTYMVGLLDHSKQKLRWRMKIFLRFCGEMESRVEVFLYSGRLYEGQHSTGTVEWYDNRGF